MKIDINNLPDDPAILKSIVLEQYKQEQKHLLTIISQQEQINILKAKVFGPSAEKLPKESEAEQDRVFNEAEKEERVKIAAHLRRRRGRKPLSKDLPSVDIIHELNGKDIIHSCGRKMKEIGEVIAKKLRVIPQQLIVEIHRRKKYACECEGVDTEGKEGAVRTAPLEPSIIPKSIATPSLLAYVLTSKFCDALPFHRQEKIFNRIGVEIPRQTMCYWAIKAHERIKPLLELMKEDLLAGPVIGMDETPVQVLMEHDRKNTTKSYMWVSRGGDTDKPVLLYRYYPSRSADFLAEYLDSYTGYLQCDGFPAYDAHTKHSGTHITVVGCWAHVRRRFFDVIKAAKNSALAHEAFEKIKQLYKIEKRARDENMSVDEIKALRQKEADPIILDFKDWLDKHEPQVPPSSTLGKAIAYAQHEWPKMAAYLEDGRIPIDNNLVENAIRPFVMGRKNWLFSGSPRGADASAGIYSMIETAKANGLEPFWYLLYLFENLPKAKSTADYHALLPYNIDKSVLKLPP